MRLYDISEADVIQVLESQEQQDESVEQSRNFALKVIKGKFKDMPLKVVYVKQGDELIVISAYPLKRAYRSKSHES